MTDSIYTYPNNIKSKIETIIIRIWTYENKLSERNPIYHTKQSLNILMRHFFRRRKNSLNRLSVRFTSRFRTLYCLRNKSVRKH